MSDMLSYYELTKDAEETGVDELEKAMFQKSTEYLQKQAEEMRKNLFHHIADDLEQWMWERIDNTKRYYFDSIVNFLCNVKTIHIPERNKEEIENFLKEIGYTTENLRRTIFEENKDVILEAITDAMIYERLENEKSFYTYFKHWDFKDVGKSYPQTEIVKHFIRYIMKKEGFEKHLSGQIDKEIEEEKEYLESLRARIREAENKLAAIAEEIGEE